MIILIVIAWLALGLIGSRLEYLFLKSPWTDKHHERNFKRSHTVTSLIASVFGICNFFAGVILYCFLRIKRKIR